MPYKKNIKFFDMLFLINYPFFRNRWIMIGSAYPSVPVGMDGSQSLSAYPSVPMAIKGVTSLCVSICSYGERKDHLIKGNRMARHKNGVTVKDPNVILNELPDSEATAKKVKRHKNGVTVKDPNVILNELPDVVGLHSSLLQSPIFVLSEATAKKVKQIVTITPHGKFIFTSASTLMPTTKHAIYFDVLSCLFSAQWNKEGKLFFRFSDVLSAVGHKKNSTNARESIVETIKRYMGSHAHWENSFSAGEGRYIAWSGSLIRKCSLFDEHGDRVRAKFGPSKTKEDWNWIVFHEEIVEALNPEHNPQTRLMLTDVYKWGLRDPEAIVYRYFYGHWDTKEVWKSLYKPHEGLIDIFKWTSPKHKFARWLNEALEGLLKKGLVQYFKYNSDKTAIAVKCANLKEIVKKEKVELLSEEPVKVTKGKRNGAIRFETIDVKNLAPEKVLEEFQARKEKNLIDAEKAASIEAILGLFSEKVIPSYVIDAVRNALI